MIRSNKIVSTSNPIIGFTMSHDNPLFFFFGRQ